MSNAGTYVGEENIANGGGTSERQSRTGDMLTSNVHGKHYEAAAAGRLFHAITTATGIVQAVVGTAAGFALYNPAGTGFNLSIISVRWGFVSGTHILGSIIHAVNTSTTAAATTGTAITPVPGLAGSGAVAVGKPLYTATLPASPTLTRVAFYKQPTPTTANNFVLEDYLDGAISLAPGTTWSTHCIGDDTADLWMISVTWEEVRA